MKLLLENWRKYLNEARYESEVVNVVAERLPSDIRNIVEEWPKTTGYPGYKIAYALTEEGLEKLKSFRRHIREQYTIIPLLDLQGGVSLRQAADVKSAVGVVVIEIEASDKVSKIEVSGQLLHNWGAVMHTITVITIPPTVDTIEKFNSEVTENTSVMQGIKSNMDHEIRHGMQNVYQDKVYDREGYITSTPDLEEIKKVIIKAVGEEAFNQAAPVGKQGGLGPGQWRFYTWRPSEIEAYIVSAIRAAQPQKDPQSVFRALKDLFIGQWNTPHGWVAWEKEGYSEEQARKILEAQAEHFYENYYLKYGSLFE